MMLVVISPSVLGLASNRVISHLVHQYIISYIGLEVIDNTLTKDLRYLYMFEAKNITKRIIIGVHGVVHDIVG